MLFPCQENEDVALYVDSYSSPHTYNLPGSTWGSTGDKGEKCDAVRRQGLRSPREMGNMDGFLFVVTPLAWTQALARSSSTGRPPDSFPAGEQTYP